MQTHIKHDKKKISLPIIMDIKDFKTQEKTPKVKA